MDFLQNNLPYILAGISTGGQYALIAIGYTMVYGILRLINFAHGDIFMTSTYIAFFIVAFITAKFAGIAGLPLFIITLIRFLRPFGSCKMDFFGSGLVNSVRRNLRNG